MEKIQRIEKLERITLADAPSNGYSALGETMKAIKFWSNQEEISLIRLGRGDRLIEKTNVSLGIKINRATFLNYLDSWLKEKDLWAFQVQYGEDLRSYRLRHLLAGGGSEDITTFGLEAKLYKKTVT